MHNNHFLIRQLASELNGALRGAVLIECFTQSKDELVLIFQRENQDAFYIQATFSGQFSTLYFHKEFRRAKHNTVTLFEPAAMQPVVSVGAVQNERAFIIYLKNDVQLIFKLFGNRSNIAVCKAGEVAQLFKPNLTLDWKLSPNAMNRSMDTSFAAFAENDFSIKRTVFTLGNLGEAYLIGQGTDSATPEGKYAMLSQLLDYLKTPKYYVAKINRKAVLSLFDMGEIISTHTGAIDALNSFYHAHFKYNFLEQHREQLLQKVERQLASSHKYVEKCRAKLQEQIAGKPLAEIANIIMANLHQIPQGTTEVELFDFYTNENITIPLNRKVSPQQHAAVLYKKSKNKHLALAQLEQQIEDKEAYLKTLQEDIDAIKSAINYKALQPYIEAWAQDSGKNAAEEEPEFKVFECMDFKIFVGRNAKNNDTLTQKFAHKNDLWLHAKDVTGSHVVIKHQSGKPFPKPVITRAAELAAHYSKRKNDSLCPVMYTLKKYVRKVKGAPDGAVRVEREQILMVVPKAD